MPVKEKLSLQDWQTFEDVASRFEHKARYQDRQDLHQDIIVRLAELASDNDNQLTKPAMFRIASYVTQEYWHDLKRTQAQVCLYNGTALPRQPNHATCSFRHKPAKCSECPYIASRPILSLNYELEDSEGNTIELWETLADDSSIDLEDWLDARRWLLGCRRRLVQIAVKIYSGKPLSHTEQMYLSRHREKELKKYQLRLV